MSRAPRVLVVLCATVLLAALAACGTSTPAPSHDAAGTVSASARTGGTRTRPATATPVTLRGPRIVIVMEENHSLDQILGSPSAPQFARLVGDGTLLTQFYSTRHPSLPNYIALLSGDTYGIVSDCGNCAVTQPSLVDQLRSAHLSWRAYMQSLPAPCSKVKVAGAYAKKHDPFMYFPAIAGDPAVCRNVVPFDRFAADAAAGRLPQVVWITPDLDHDMHGGPGDTDPGDAARSDAQVIASADQFLGQLYDTLRSSPAWQQDTRLVVTWDEGGGSQPGDHGCCGGDAVGGHVPTVVVGPRVPHGTDATPYDHYALLRSIETALGLPYLAHAADAGSHDIPVVATPGTPG